MFLSDLDPGREPIGGASVLASQDKIHGTTARQQPRPTGDNQFTERSSDLHPWTFLLSFSSFRGRADAAVDRCDALRERSCAMAAKSVTVSLTPELRAAVDRRVRSGRYGDATDVVRAGLRALEREEQGNVWREWLRARAGLPREPLTPEVEQAIERRIRVARLAERRKSR